MMRKRPLERPTIEAIKTEISRIQYNRRYQAVLRSTIYTLITVAAVAVLVATLWLPVLQIYGSSMTPTLQDGQIVFSLKTEQMEPGDVIAFYDNNKILIKRVIGVPGDWIEIDTDGTVYLNGEKLDEPYAEQIAFGECDLEFPFQVPQEQYFVLGDMRESSIDSRNTLVGCVEYEQIIGKIFFRIWPFQDIRLF
jgi:signal peptidase I